MQDAVDGAGLSVSVVRSIKPKETKKMERDEEYACTIYINAGLKNVKMF